MLPLLSLLGTASAGGVVLHANEDPEMARARVAVAVGISPADLETSTLAAALDGLPPMLIGPGEVTACSGAFQTSLAEALDAAEGAVMYMEYDTARATLATASASFTCLTEPLDPAQGARVWFLQGLVAHELGDKSAAWEAFRQARLIAPDLSWDENFSPTARPLFDGVGAELANTPSSTLMVVPEPPVDAFWVNGQATDTEQGRLPLVSGNHLVQIGQPTRSLSLSLNGDLDAALVLPSELPADIATWALQDERRDALVPVLLAAGLGKAAVFIPTSGAVWRYDPSTSIWAEFDPAGGLRREIKPLASTPPAPEAPSSEQPISDAPPPTKERSSMGRRLTIWTGAGLTLTGGTLAVLNYAKALGAYNSAVAATDQTTWDAAAATYGDAALATRNGLIITGIGAATLGTGLLFLDGTSPGVRVTLNRW